MTWPDTRWDCPQARRQRGTLGQSAPGFGASHRTPQYAYYAYCWQPTTNSRATFRTLESGSESENAPFDVLTFLRVGAKLGDGMVALHKCRAWRVTHQPREPPRVTPRRCRAADARRAAARLASRRGPRPAQPVPHRQAVPARRGAHPPRRITAARARARPAARIAPPCALARRSHRTDAPLSHTAPPDARTPRLAARFARSTRSSCPPARRCRSSASATSAARRCASCGARSACGCPPTPSAPPSWRAWTARCCAPPCACSPRARASGARRASAACARQGACAPGALSAPNPGPNELNPHPRAQARGPRHHPRRAGALRRGLRGGRRPARSRALYRR
jgi:hypothetical protein